jgi:hypothetical protein
MGELLNEKVGAFERTVKVFKSAPFAAVFTVSVLLNLYQYTQRDELYKAMVDEVRKQVKPEVTSQMSGVQSTADSTKAIVVGYGAQIDTTLVGIRKATSKLIKNHK